MSETEIVKWVLCQEFARSPFSSFRSSHFSLVAEIHFLSFPANSYISNFVLLRRRPRDAGQTTFSRSPLRMSNGVSTFGWIFGRGWFGTPPRDTSTWNIRGIVFSECKLSKLNYRNFLFFGYRLNNKFWFEVRIENNFSNFFKTIVTLNLVNNYFNIAN